MIAIAVSEFNAKIAEGLLEGCRTALLENGYHSDQIIIVRVPGAFELPTTAKRLSQRQGIRAVITLGAVIRGETDHYHYISTAVSTGIMQVTLESPVPVLFGVLTCQDGNLARARSTPGNRQNKGYEVGLAAAQMTSS